MPLNPRRVQAVFLEAADYDDPVDRAAILDQECSADLAFAGASRRSRGPTTRSAASPRTRSAPLSRGSVTAARIGLLGDSESADPVHAGLQPRRLSSARSRAHAIGT